MWIILWKDRMTGQAGALKCPGSQSQAEAESHARALGVLFPERAFRITWVCQSSQPSYC